LQAICNCKIIRNNETNISAFKKKKEQQAWFQNQDVECGRTGYSGQQEVERSKEADRCGREKTQAIDRLSQSHSN
jgi:uncharacterized protein YecT (DUF1311 family)